MTRKDDVLRAIDRELTRLRVPRALEHGGCLLPSLYSLLGCVDLGNESVDGGDPTVSAIAETLGVDVSTASRQITTAVGLGLLAVASAPSDKRVRIVVATPTGRRCLRDERRRRDRVIRGITEVWSAEELADLARVLRHFNALGGHPDRPERPARQRIASPED